MLSDPCIVHMSLGGLPHLQGHLVRCPTPYPKEMREKARHMRNLAMRQTLGDSTEPTSWSPHVDHKIVFQQEVVTHAM